MNKDRRKRLDQARDLVEQAKAILEECQYEEQQYKDDMPDNMQNSEKGGKAQEAADSLQEAFDNCESIVDQSGTSGRTGSSPCPPRCAGTSTNSATVSQDCW